MGHISSHSDKAQLFTTDMIVSAVIFTVILAVSFSAFNIQEENQFRFNDEEAMREKATQIAALMVRTGGHPVSWSNTTVQVIGFAPGDDHVLHNDTVQQLNSTDSRLTYTDAQDVLDLEEADFHVNVSTDNYTFTYGKKKDWSNLSNSIDDLVFQERSVLVKDDGFLERGSMFLAVYTQ